MKFHGAVTIKTASKAEKLSDSDAKASKVGCKNTSETDTSESASSKAEKDIKPAKSAKAKSDNGMMAIIFANAEKMPADAKAVKMSDPANGGSDEDESDLSGKAAKEDDEDLSSSAKAEKGLMAKSAKAGSEYSSSANADKMSEGSSKGSVMSKGSKEMSMPYKSKGSKADDNDSTPGKAGKVHGPKVVKTSKATKGFQNEIGQGERKITGRCHGGQGQEGRCRRRQGGQYGKARFPYQAERAPKECLLKQRRQVVILIKCCEPRSG